MRRLICALLISAASGQEHREPRSFKANGIEVVLAQFDDKDAGKIDPVIILDRAAEGDVAIVTLFYYKRGVKLRSGPAISTDLMFSYTVVCPAAIKGAGAACDPPVPLKPEQVEFVRVKILRTVSEQDLGR